MNQKKFPLPGSISNKNTPIATRTLGPVSDLERHLPSDWWRTLFNSLYLKTDGDVVENPENTKREIDLVTQIAALEPNDRILDLCCGQGRHSLELARRGFVHVTGVDRSRYLIRLARKRAKAEGLSVAFHEGDARKYNTSERLFHCVMLLGNSFGYFEQKTDDEILLNNVSKIISPSGIIVLDVVDGEWMSKHFEPRSWEWIDENHFVCRERAFSQDRERIVTRELITHAEKGVLADQFYAERLYTGEQLKDLLENCGYRLIHFHDVFESDSTRGQDLGMMAHRIFLSAQAPKRTVRVSPHKKPLFSHVTVLLGDPTLPDRVKVNGKFNKEDFDTIQRLKLALEELEDYTFTYLENHQNLLKSLIMNPPEFVFNLCDEGFRNEPFMELHISTVLEMLDIPYSGAGPACLGICYDKNLTRAVAESLEIPVPLESYLGPDDLAATIPATFPALVKPNFGDSSMGITKDAVVHDTMELMNYIEWIRKTFGKCSILVQEFLTGPEYSIGIIGNPGLTFKTLCPLEVDYSALDSQLPYILGYESKWHPDSPYWNQIAYKRASFDDDIYRQLIDYASMLFERLGCNDYARFDFRVDEHGTIKLLEVNPNPGWCWDGKLNIMAGFEGLRYADLLRMILEAAQERISSQ
ncbi:MAG TPA: methyltransferase domain-containing protein [Anaerolineae bacterium]|nr:methyltransferase domain-containing protein [Anaerolineae bacterium]